jgi:hypothetical protein
MNPLFGEDLVNELRKRSDGVTNRLWVAVPYLGGAQSVRRILGKQWMHNTGLSIRLLTDISELNRFNSETIALFDILGEIRHLAGLHAKIFIIDDLCLITSANLTNTAFSKRHEIGIFLDHSISSKAISIFERWWRNAAQVSQGALKTVHNRQFVCTEERQGSMSLPHLWNLPDDPGDMNYWLKPVGVTGDPVTEDRTFDDIKERLHFSKVKPTGVKIGDILVAYGVGARRILSIYQVTSKPRFDTTNRRWPWYVLALNLTPRFGRSWAKHSIYADDIRERYLRVNPQKHITKVGGTTFGGLNLGKDKLKLDPEFAQYVIQRITKLNRG